MTSHVLYMDESCHVCTCVGRVVSHLRQVAALVCDMTHSYVCHDLIVCVSFICVHTHTGVVSHLRQVAALVCDMTHSYV